MNVRFIACNHGVQSALYSMSLNGSAYCTQQTGVLTQGMILRAMHAADAEGGGKARCSTSSPPSDDIACNMLPYVFARLGLLPQEAMLWHVRNQFVEHAALPEQRVCA
jgi:hypothetical protein